MPQPPYDEPADAADRRRATILSEARRAFMGQGYAAARMEPIAREAGVSTATLYQAFRSKAELFDAVIADASDDFAGCMAAVTASDGPAPELLTNFGVAYADFMGDPFVRSVFRLVMAERPRFRSTAQGFFERGRRDFGGPLMSALERLVQRGELRPLKASWAAGQFMGMIEHPVFFMPLVTGDDVKAQRTHRQIADDAAATFLARYGA